MISCQRHLFDIPDDVAYLNCAYMSPLMKSVRDAGHKGIERKVHPWTVSPPDFFSESETVRQQFARLVNATADDIALVPAVSYGIAVAAANLPAPTGSRILTLEEQFPSNIYTWRDLAKENGAEVISLPRPADDDWTRAILAAIDDRVSIAALPHVHWTDGALIDLAAVGEALRTVGAALVVDLTQSLGALPFDAQKIQPDFAVCATYKWLMGPYSAGFLYVAPQHQDGRPLEQSWIARLGSENFSGLVDYQDAYQPGARRYDVGERSNFILLPMASAAMAQLLEWGPDNIQATLAATTTAMAARAAALGLTSVTAGKRAGHYLGLRFPGGVPDGLPDRLAAQNVLVSVRGDSMRVTPHLYNNQADIDRLFAVLEAL